MFQQGGRSPQNLDRAVPHDFSFNHLIWSELSRAHKAYAQLLCISMMLAYRRRRHFQKRTFVCAYFTYQCCYFDPNAMPGIPSDYEQQSLQTTIISKINITVCTSNGLCRSSNSQFLLFYRYLLREKTKVRLIAVNLIRNELSFLILSSSRKAINFK